MSDSVSVHRLGDKMVNYYLVAEGGELTLIDTGNKVSIDKIREKFKKFGHDLDNLKRIILTHSHFDHGGSLAVLKEATGATVMAHEAEAPYVAQEARMPKPRGIGGYLFLVIEPFFRARPAQVDVALHDGDTIEGTGFKVIHVPGHTPGSICLYHTEAKALFTGDTLIYRNGKILGPISVFSSDIRQARQSVGKLVDLDIDTIYFNHGGVMRDVPEGAVGKLYASLKK